MIRHLARNGVKMRKSNKPILTIREMVSAKTALILKSEKYCKIKYEYDNYDG